MNLSYFIARRYFVSTRKKGSKHGLTYKFFRFLLIHFTFSPRKINQAYKDLVDAFIGQNFIKILSNISMFGVGFGAAALIIVLSLFNGMEVSITSMFNRHNPELKIQVSKGKTFTYDEVMREKINKIAGVEAVTEVMEDNTLLIYGEKQKVVTLKGVSENFALQTRLDTTIILGSPALQKDRAIFALVGSGVYQELSMRIKDRVHLLQFWYPKRSKKVSLNPNRAFNRTGIQAGGVFVTEPQFDINTVIVSLDFADKLFKYGENRSYLEIKVDKNHTVSEVQESLEEYLGENFTVKNRQEQQAHLLRALQIEKLFAFATFVIILGIASFNVFFSLVMLTIEKKKDISMLKAIGATQKLIKRIFLMEGGIIALTGGFFGFSLGVILCLIQQEFGILKTGLGNSGFDSYPIDIRLTDSIIVLFTVILITLLAAYVPARNASK